MAIAQRRQTEASVVARIVGIAHADHGNIEQVDDRRQNLLTRKTALRHMAADGCTHIGQRLCEVDQALILVLIPFCPECRVIAVLLATPRIAPRRLKMTVGVRAYPHIPIGRGYGQRADTGQRRLVLDRRSIRATIGKASAGSAARNARDVVTNEIECRLCVGRCGRCHALKCLLCNEGDTLAWRTMFRRGGCCPGGT